MRPIWRQPGRIRCGNVNGLLLLAHGVGRHRVTFQPSDGEAGERSVVIFTVLAHSDCCQAGAGQAARHQASGKKYPARKVMPVVIANTRRRSKIVASGNLRASDATHDSLLFWRPSTWPRSPLYKWQCLLPEKRDRRNEWMVLGFFCCLLMVD